MDDIEILYNGRCPICSAEIAQYDRAAQKAGAPLRFTDLHSAELASWGLSADQATRRLHARADGQIISGFPAFLILWEHLPRLKWLARLLALPGLRHLAELGYNRLAAPVLYQLHLRRMAKGG
jgi:predicted DCC family thiol-disulfide oxidoreductase YuxK